MLLKNSLLHEYNYYLIALSGYEQVDNIQTALSAGFAGESARAWLAEVGLVSGRDAYARPAPPGLGDLNTTALLNTSPKESS